MKRIFLAALIGVGMVALIFPLFSGVSAARTPEDYPLVCRGSANLQIGTAPGEGNFGFVFTRGTKPASQGLAPGECSWVDRGMHADEPDRLSHHVEDGSQSLNVGGSLAPEIRWYEELHSPDKYWTFQVYNNGRGQLIATEARPNGAESAAKLAYKPVTFTKTGDRSVTTSAISPSGDCGLPLPCSSVVSSTGTALDIRNTGGGDGIYGVGSKGVYGQSSVTNGYGVVGATDGPTGYGVWGINLTGFGVRGLSGSGTGVFGESGGVGVFAQTSGAGLRAPAIRANNTNAGGIGIWSTTDSSDANVVITNTGSGDLMRGFSGGSGGDLVFQVLNNGTTNVKALETSISTGTGVHGRSSANTLSDSAVFGENTGGGIGVRGQSNGTAVFGLTTGKSGAGVNGISFNAEGVGGRFTNPAGVALEVLGTASMKDVQASEVQAGVIKITGGSDLAERFEVSDEAKPGMVMAIDPDHPGGLCIAKGTYNRRVAGILSGANNLGAGMVLADLPGAKNSMPMALSGRVWVFADATNKSIEPGDLLTTADLPGYAMAVTDYTRARGAIIGKAMTGLKHGQGLILVFVTLQ